jgi:hypothetical protein
MVLATNNRGGLFRMPATVNILTEAGDIACPPRLMLTEAGDLGCPPRLRFCIFYI